MNLLTLTKETQGWRKNDFFRGEEGEIANFAFECDSDRDNVDGNCGCRRSMGGIKSMRASTTMKVRDIDITSTELRRRIKEWFIQAEWGSFFTSRELDHAVNEYQKDLERLGRHFPEGAVVEKRGDEFRQRKEGVWKPDM